MELLLKKIALIIAALTSLLGFAPKLGGAPIEVLPFYHDFNDLQYFKIAVNRTETEITKTEYDNIILKDGEVKHTNGRKKATVLKENEYYYTGGKDVGSTTPEVKYKKDGIESIKFLNEIQ